MRQPMTPHLRLQNRNQSPSSKPSRNTWQTLVLASCGNRRLNLRSSFRSSCSAGARQRIIGIFATLTCEQYRRFERRGKTCSGKEEKTGTTRDHDLLLRSRTRWSLSAYGSSAPHPPPPFQQSRRSGTCSMRNRLLLRHPLRRSYRGATYSPRLSTGGKRIAEHNSLSRGLALPTARRANPYRDPSAQWAGVPKGHRCHIRNLVWPVYHMCALHHWRWVSDL